MTSIDRRVFLQRGALLAGSLALPNLLAACSKSAVVPKPTSLDGLINDAVKRGGAKGLQIFQAGEDYVAGINNRVAVGLVSPGANGVPIIGKDAKVWLSGPSGGSLKGPLVASWEGYSKPEALPAPQGTDAFEIAFDRPGIWQTVFEVEQDGHLLVGTVALQVKPKSDTKIPGQKAIPSQTPTFDNHRGVNPICTRTPPCNMHNITLAKALTLRKPTAFIVATPKFCMSRTCGPNLEELITIEREFGPSSVGGTVSFVHAEVYHDDKPDTIAKQIASPTFAQWGFQSEPWLFLIDRDGKIATRFEGPVTADIIRPAMQRLA